MRPHPILDRRLLFVSGKGGAGKTVVAAAVALYASRQRRRVLLVELSPYGRIHELLGAPVPGPEPMEIQPRLELVRIEPRRALEEFLQGILPVRALRRRLLASHAFSIFTAAAPGIEEFLVLTEIAHFEAMRGGLRRRRRYDLLVVDAPATGHSLPLLSTARTLIEMMPIGPIGRAAGEVNRLLGDPRRTAAVIVTLAEEMAVNETLEIVGGLSRSRVVALGPLLVNAVWPQRFTAEEAQWLTRAGADAADPLIAVGRYHVERRQRAEAQLARLRRELRLEPIEIPFVVDSTLDRPELRRLVGVLEEAISPAEGSRA
jgi:anion-transporting  ArsA/GET3 family ATPase